MTKKTNKILFDGKSLITRGSMAKGSPPEAADVLRDGRAGTALTRLGLILGIAHDRFVQGVNPTKILRSLTAELHSLRKDVEGHVWHALIPHAQEHPVSRFLLQDPLTKWSFEKPRGYSGDAELIDLIYRHPSVEAHITEASLLGHALFEYTSSVSSSVAVRERRDRLTALVDETAAVSGGQLDILAVAAGHLREAERSVALREGRIRRWVAIDQDPYSVGIVARDFAGTSVEALGGSVRGLLKNTYDLGSFDIIYAAGLYDYLPQKVAASLTRSCRKMLNPDGIFLFANFAEGLAVDAYMETFMDWPLLFREEADMWAIINSSVDRNKVAATVYRGDNSTILYGEIRV